MHFSNFSVRSRRSPRPLTVLALLGLAVSLSLSAGCSWVTNTVSDYMGGESNATPPTPLVKFKPTLTVHKVWSSQLGDGTDKHYLKLEPAADGEKVYGASRGGDVSALWLKNGKPAWEHDTDQPISGGPGIGDGLVLLGTSNGEVIALAKDTGKELWHAIVSSEVLAAPRASQGVVVVRTLDGKLFGLDATNGKRLWVYDVTVPVLILRGSSSPIIAQGMVIAGFDSGRVVALDLKTGKQVWEQRVAVPRGRTDLERMVDIDAEPIVVGDTVYVATYQGHVAALSLTTGSVIWTRDVSSYAGIAVDSKYVYVTDDESNLWALDRRTGASVWKQDKLKARSLSGPAAVDGYVVVGDYAGYVHWLRASDGQFAARTHEDDTRIIASPIVTDKLVLVYSSGGKLVAYRRP